MPSSNVCWGIEIGAGALKAVKLEAAGGEVRVLDFVLIPHKKVLSTPDLDQNDMLRVTLGAFASQVDLTGASVAVSVPGHSAFARFAKLPPVEPRKIPDIVKFEAVQQIPFPIDQVEWDYQTFRSPDSPDVEVGIFAITRDRIMERLTMYEDVGMVPDYVTLSPVAAYNALAYDLQFTEKTPGTIILDIGTTSTDLVIAEAGRVWIRTFPIGGHHFTEALVNGFQLSYPKAEKLKREAESSKHARHIFQQMRPVFGDLAQDVQRSIGYYQSLHKDAKLERLIGLGSTFRLPGLRKYLKQQLQIDVYRMEQFKRLSLDGPRAGEFQAQTLNLATAYGLALQGIGMAALEANLMPAAVIRDAMWKRKTKWFGVAAGIAIAASAAMFYRPFVDNVEVADNPPARVIEETIRTANRYKSEASELTSAEISNADAVATMALLENREIHARILADLRQMLAAAQGMVGKQDGPVFVVKEFTTDFVTPMADPNADPSAAPAGEELPRVDVELVVTTTHPEAHKFAITALGDWLRINGKRPEVPYEILTERNAVVRTNERVGAAAGDPQGSPGGQYGAPVIDTRNVVNTAEAPRGRLGSSGDRMMSEGAPMQSGSPDEPASQNLQAALESVKRLAPLPGETPLAPGVRETEFTVRWRAVILPKNANPEGGAT